MCACCFFFFFKQKTAYEMRISDWSSDVCSSDLRAVVGLRRGRIGETRILADVAENAREGGLGDEGADVVHHQASQRSAGLGRQHHADEYAHGGADDVDLTAVEPGDEQSGRASCGERRG